MLPSSDRSPARFKRRGFSLVELLIVIVVIAIIVAMLLPAIFGVRSRADDTRVATEILGLEEAIARFKADHGIEPPSRITLGTAGAWSDTRSKEFMRQMWPNANFSEIESPTGATVTLNGAECLVFFLGGVSNANASPKTYPSGFASSVSNPFSTAGARKAPYYTFDPSRLVDSNGNGFWEYRDSTSRTDTVYQYFSSYDGQGYDTDDVSAAGTSLTNIYHKGSTANAHKPNNFQIISAGADGLYGVGGLFNPTATNAGLGNSGDYDNLTNIQSGRLKP